MSRVYQVKDAEQAHIKVYLTNNKQEADLIVTQVSNLLEARAPTHWFIEKDRLSASTWIFFTSTKAEADLSIYFSTDRLKAAVITSNPAIRQLR